MQVTVHNRQRARRVRGGALAAFLERVAVVLPLEGGPSVDVRLVSDRTMRRYNHQFRGYDRPTDVLAFPAGQTVEPGGPPHLGDLLISVPTAATQARHAGHGLERELKLLALHGYLHLLGYDHETDDGAMRSLERGLRRRLLPRRGARSGR